MPGFETSENVQPQEEGNNCKTESSRQGSLLLAVTVLFVLVCFLCANNYVLLNSYKELRGKLVTAYEAVTAEKEKKQEFASKDIALIEQLNKLTDENRKLKEDYGKASRGSSDMSRQMEALKKQNGELSKRNSELSGQNKSLVDDNVALQNSLKMAASVGVKPQNFSLFEGLTARNQINRGKYLGKFLGTAYTPSKEECGNDKGITRSGKAIIPGVSIAVDNDYWPFGTVFYVKGLGYTVAMDTGSGIKGRYRFDFSVFDKKFANLLGARKWEVYLVRLGKGYVGDIKL